VNLKDILIPHLKKAFRLTDFQSSLIQSAFFGGYFLAALPAGWLMERIGYRKGILVGLLTCATGALLFIPAASVHSYGFFLFALFVMACGQGVLEVAANPCVTILGPPESSERRLTSRSLSTRSALWSLQSSAAPLPLGNRVLRYPDFCGDAARVGGLLRIGSKSCQMPYLGIAALFLLAAALVCIAHLPEIREDATYTSPCVDKTPVRHWEVLKYKHLVQGVVAQFFNVGAEFGVTAS
jgi:MFS transporter, FHS family, L-fucose permease